VRRDRQPFRGFRPCVPGTNTAVSRLIASSGSTPCGPPSGSRRPPIVRLGG
jgi:hypothetical protein